MTSFKGQTKNTNQIMEGLNMKKINRREIMNMAWSIYRKHDDGSEIKPLFSVCLQMAWEHMRNNSAAVLSAWEGMSVERQISYISACVKRAAKDEIAYSVEDQYNAFNEPVAWFLRNHDLDEFVSEAWIKLSGCMSMEYLEKRNAKRVAAGKVNVSLSSLVYGAAVHAINKVWRDDVKHGRAQEKTVTDKDGNTYSYIDTLATSRKDSTEAKAIGSLGLSEFMNQRDEADRIIIEGIREGYKGKEIALMIGISAPAVTKRLKKLRRDLVEAGMAPGWLAAG